MRPLVVEVKGMETAYFTNPNLSAIKNRFDDALEELRSIIMAEKLNTKHQTNNYQKLIDQLTK